MKKNKVWLCRDVPDDLEFPYIIYARNSKVRLDNDEYWAAPNHVLPIMEAIPTKAIHKYFGKLKPGTKKLIEITVKELKGGD